MESIDDDLTPGTALALVQSFLPNEWKNIDPKDVSLKVIQ